MLVKDYFIPMINIKVDLERIRKEIDYFVKPDYSLQARSYGLTTSKEYVDDPNFDFRKHMAISSPDANGIRRLPGGELDSDVVLWPKIMEGSYIKYLGEMFSSFIKIPNPRCRMSVINGPFEIQSHVDEHTPYRIHICLDSDPGSNWFFKKPDDVHDMIHQPSSETPVLIETGTVEHSVKVEPGTFRMHLWYQFHSVVQPDIIQSLMRDIESYKNSIRNKIC